MKTRLFGKKIALALAIGLLHGAASADFIALGHPNESTGAEGHLFIFGNIGVTGTISSNDAAMNQSFTIGPSGVVDVLVPSSQFLNPGNVVLNKALKVTSASPISGYFLNREAFTTDMSYLLDLPALGTEYRILGWQATYGLAQMSATALQDGTTVTITPAASLSSGQAAGIPFTVSLNAGQSALYLAPTGNDLTGSLINANKPLAVFSGAQCTNVPASALACDHIFTQIPSVNQFASEYIVPETANTGSAGNLVRIVAASDNTIVTVNGTVVATLAAGAFHEIAVANSLQISTTKPVLVGQFLKGNSATGFGDPALSFIPGIAQTLNDYAFTTPTASANNTAFDENFLNLAVPTTALPSLKLNGVAVDTSSFIPVGSSGFSSGFIAVPVGAGRINASAKFLATLSGFTEYDSYHTIIGTNYSSGGSPPVVTPPTSSTPIPVDSKLALLLASLGLAGLAGWKMRSRRSNA